MKHRTLKHLTLYLVVKAAVSFPASSTFSALFLMKRSACAFLLETACAAKVIPNFGAVYGSVVHVYVHDSRSAYKNIFSRKTMSAPRWINLAPITKVKRSQSAGLEIFSSSLWLLGMF